MTFSLTRFILTENAYFFTIRKAITKKAIDGVIAVASGNKKGAFLYKKAPFLLPEATAITPSIAFFVIAFLIVKKYAFSVRINLVKEKVISLFLGLISY